MIKSYGIERGERVVDEKKIRVMTGMAMYEKKEAREILESAHVSKRKFVMNGVVETFLITNVSLFFIGLVVAMINPTQAEKIEQLVNTFTPAKLWQLPWGIYAAFVIIYTLIATYYYSSLYDRTRVDVKRYESRRNILKKMNDSSSNKKES